MANQVIAKIATFTNNHPFGNLWLSWYDNVNHDVPKFEILHRKWKCVAVSCFCRHAFHIHISSDKYFSLCLSIFPFISLPPLTQDAIPFMPLPLSCSHYVHSCFDCNSKADVKCDVERLSALAFHHVYLCHLCSCCSPEVEGTCIIERSARHVPPCSLWNVWMTTLAVTTLLSSLRLDTHHARFFGKDRRFLSQSSFNRR